MRTVPTGLASHILGNVTSLCRIVTVTRLDGTIVRFTDAQDDLTVDGHTYLAGSGAKASAIQSRADGTASNVTITIASVDNGLVDFGEVLAGRYDSAAVTIALVNHLDATESLTVFTGNVGTTQIDDRGQCSFDVRGLTARARSQVAPRYQQTCRADLGDSQCKIPILPDDVQRSTSYAVGDFVRAKSGGTGWADYGNVYYECTGAGTTASSAPTYDATVGNATTDGTATFTARNAWLRYGVVASVTSDFTITVTLTEPRAVDDWFKWGAIIWRSGANEGSMVEVRGWIQSSSTLTIMMPTAGVVNVGDEFEIFAGCDKRASTCRTKFDNLPNFRGEPHVPGPVTA